MALPQAFWKRDADIQVLKIDLRGLSSRPGVVFLLVGMVHELAWVWSQISARLVLRYVMFCYVMLCYVNLFISICIYIYVYICICRYVYVDMYMSVLLRGW